MPRPDHVAVIPQLRRQFGNASEDVATQFLIEQGYEVLDRNVSNRYGEIDIVTRKEGLLAFVEVRSRSSLTWGSPALTILASKRDRLVKAAMWYLQMKHFRDCMIRFDVIAIVGQPPEHQIEFIPNAFDAGM